MWKVSANLREDISEDDIDPEYLKHVIDEDARWKEQFLEITGGRYEDERNVHEKAEDRPFGLTIFYRYFFTKYVSNRKREDAVSGMLNDHASIFPFQTKPAKLLSDDSNMPELDNEFSVGIAEFVRTHFGDHCDVDELKKLFWNNIKDFRRNYFPRPPTFVELTRVIEVGSEAPNWRDRRPSLNCEYLENFIRLNDAGSRWYQMFQVKFNKACEAHEKRDLILPHKHESYFKYLPEINCCELLLLLETDFYEENEAKYIHLFKKYLFFFKNAYDRQDHPICFIDETLFACLQFKREYETFQEDKSIYDSLWDLCLMTLVHQRKHRDYSNQEINVRPSRSDLENVVAYADELLVGVESINVYYGVPEYPRFQVFLQLDDTVFLINYSSRGNHGGRDRIGQILKSALLIPNTREFKHYNAYLGEESTCRMPELPQRRHELCQFLERLTKIEREANRLRPRHSMKFLLPHEVRHYFATLPVIPRYGSE